LWQFLLAYFPKQYRPALLQKLRGFINSAWEELPTDEKIFPIQEKWPIFYLRAL